MNNHLQQVNREVHGNNFPGHHEVAQSLSLKWSSRAARLVVLAIYGALLFFVAVPQLSAQLTVGGVVGTVKDTTGAVIKGAALTLTNEATGITQTTVSTATGTYVFASVKVGMYTLKASSQGFKTYVESGIQIHIQNTVTVDIQLSPGAVKQQVIVTSAAPLLQAQDATLGQTVTTQTINDLPLSGRNWFQLTKLAPGTYNSGFINGADDGQEDYLLNGTDDNTEVFGGSNIGPVPDAMQEFKLQDGDNNAEFGQFAGPVVNAEIKSGTNHFNGDIWEYARNQIFDANGYFNNLHNTPRQPYSENQWGGTIGGPVWIPGLYNGRNKTFFFFDFQHTGIKQQATYTETVPTSSMRSSGFTDMQDLLAGNSGTQTDAEGRVFPNGTVMDPATTRAIAPGAVDPVTGFVNTSSSTIDVRDPFFTGGSVAGIKNFTGLASELNMIPQNRLDPNAVKLLDGLPAPTVAGLHNNYYVTPPSSSRTNQYDVRIDEHISAKDQVWGVFDRTWSFSPAVQPFPGAYGEALGGQNSTSPHYEISLHYTHVFSPEMVNQMTGGYTHVRSIVEAPSANTLGIPAQYGIQGIPQFLGNGGLPDFSIAGFSSFGGHGYRPTISADTGLQFQDNLMRVWRNHQFNIGFNFNHVRGNILQPSSSKGVFTYNGQYTAIPNANRSLTGIADLLVAPEASTVSSSPGVTPIDNLGSMSDYYGSNFASTDYFGDYLGAYFQDNWRPTSKLTLNLGVRWDYFSPYGESNGREGNLILNGGNGPGGIYYMPAKGCAVARSAAFNTLLAANDISVECLSGLSVNKAQKDNYAPRLGVAYRILPRLVVRAGYGISYGAFDSVGFGNTLGTNYPFLYTAGAPSTTSQLPELLPNGDTATMENTFAAVNLSNPEVVNPDNMYMFGKQYHYLTPYVESGNLTIQDQFTDRDSLTVAYVASLGRNLDTEGSHNANTQILPPGVNPQTYIPVPDLARGSQYLQTIAVSNYHSLQVSYEHQFKSGLILMANDTYGKCLSDSNGFVGQLGSGYRAEWLPGFGIGPDYQLCKGSVKNVIHASGQYALPFGHGKPFLGNIGARTNAVIGGWQFNFIFSGQTGSPITIGCASGTTSDFGCNANMVPGENPYAGPHNRTQWLNPNAFTTPPVATAQSGSGDYAVLGGRAEQVVGPGWDDLDASLFKNFSTGRNTSLQFRAEFFNVLNAVEFGNPGQLNYSQPTAFSSITGTSVAARVGQFALKWFY